MGSRNDVALAILRVAVGAFLLPHGLGKVFGWFGGPGIAGFTAELAHFGLPASEALAWMLAAAQIAAGGLLVLGLATRMSALVAATFLATTAFLNSGNGWFWNHGGMEYPVLWALAAALFVGTGGGPWSLDRFIGAPGLHRT